MEQRAASSDHALSENMFSRASCQATVLSLPPKAYMPRTSHFICNSPPAHQVQDPPLPHQASKHHLFPSKDRNLLQSGNTNITCQSVNDIPTSLSSRTDVVQKFSSRITNYSSHNDSHLPTWPRFCQTLASVLSRSAA